MSSAPDPRLGSVLRGKWRLEHRLGSGGMGSVYVASHTIGRRDAIKILRTEAARDPLIRERFRREAEAVNRFVHPGVVEVRDIDETEDGCPFLVMELLDGQSLSDRAREHGYPPLAEVLHVAVQLLDVLAAAHAQGIVHRDIKPANLFLLRDGRLKVLDFGVAQVKSGQPLTELGTRLGTVAYMPPEQVRGQPIDARADLFAVGATMFRLIAQRSVHEADDDKELVIKMATKPAPPLATVAPHVPEPVCQVVDRALQFDADARYPDAATMLEDVRAVMAGYAPPFASGGRAVGASPVAASVAPAPVQMPVVAAPVVAAPVVAAPVQMPVPVVAAPVQMSAPVVAGVVHVAAPVQMPAPVHVAAPVQVWPSAPGPVAPPVQAPAPVVPSPAPAWSSAPRVPARAPWGSEPSSVLTQATAWTELSPKQRRTRWALLAFPLLGLAVAVLVFQLVVRVGVSEAPEPSEGEAVADGAWSTIVLAWMRGQSVNEASTSSAAPASAPAEPAAEAKPVDPERRKTQDSEAKKRLEEQKRAAEKWREQQRRAAAKRR